MCQELHVEVKDDQGTTCSPDVGHKTELIIIRLGEKLLCLLSHLLGPQMESYLRVLFTLISHLRV